MSISSISSSFYKKAGKAFSKTLDSNNHLGKFLTKQLKKGIDDPAKFASQMMVLSFVSKDAINCVLYTYQSYNNKKIPEDKRKFVASLDLMNGIFNVAGQLLAAIVLEKALTPIFTSKFTGTIKNKDTGAEKFVSSTAPMSEDNVRFLAKQVMKDKNIDLKNVDMKALVKQVNKISKEPLAKGLGLIITTLGTTALIKRTLVPLVATPLAGWFKDKYLTDKKKPEIQMTPAMVDSTMAKTEPNRPKLNVVSKA